MDRVVCGGIPGGIVCVLWGWGRDRVGAGLEGWGRVGVKGRWRTSETGTYYLKCYLRYVGRPCKKQVSMRYSRMCYNPQLM